MCRRIYPYYAFRTKLNPTMSQYGAFIGHLVPNQWPDPSKVTFPNEYPQRGEYAIQ